MMDDISFQVDIKTINILFYIVLGCQNDSKFVSFIKLYCFVSFCIVLNHIYRIIFIEPEYEHLLIPYCMVTYRNV